MLSIGSIWHCSSWISVLEVVFHMRIVRSSDAEARMRHVGGELVVMGCQTRETTDLICPVSLASQASVVLFQI